MTTGHTHKHTHIHTHTHTCMQLKVKEEDALTVALMGTYSTGLSDDPFLPSCRVPTWKPLDFTQNLNLALM